MWAGVLIGTLIVLSSQVWPLAWLGMEVNLMCFIPLLSGSINKKSVLIVYFIIQSVGSLAMLSLGVLGAGSVCCALALKMSLGPFHFWAPYLVENLKGAILVVFLTWQKVGPLFILLSLSFSMLILILVNIIMGPLLALSALDLPVLMLFSGLGHMSWVMSCTGGTSFVYFMFYCTLSGLILLDKSPSKIMQLMCLAGLPPMTGFMMKLLALQSIMPWLWVVLLLGSSLVIYSYMRGFMLSGHSNVSPLALVICWSGIFLLFV